MLGNEFTKLYTGLDKTKRGDKTSATHVSGRTAVADDLDWVAKGAVTPVKVRERDL